MARPIRRPWLLIVIALSLLATSCASASSGTATPEPTISEATVPERIVPETTIPEATIPETTAPETTAPETTAPEATVPTTSPPPSTALATTTTTSTTTTTTVEIPGFSSLVQEIDFSIEARMSQSWRPGCPVGLDQLRLVTLSHWNYQDAPATGELVVHADHVDDVVQVFEILYNERFPIERMELVDVFQGDDNLSMDANNTSAFNCREVANRPGVWSNHATGTAIDINPLVNPYLSSSGQILPRQSAEFVDRSVQVKGGIYSGDVVTTAFADIGWGWGGDWSSSKDWQHFSASGT